MCLKIEREREEEREREREKEEEGTKKRNAPKTLDMLSSVYRARLSALLTARNGSSHR